MPRQGPASTAIEPESDNSDSEDDADPDADPTKPWLAQFHRYLNTYDVLPAGMDVVEWWGVDYPPLLPWGSLGRDHLSIMASSVSSERAFSSAGITLSKQRNRLQKDIVEPLQIIKCQRHGDLLFRELITAEADERNMDEELTTGEVENELSWEEALIQDEDIADSDSKVV